MKFGSRSIIVGVCLTVVFLWLTDAILPLNGSERGNEISGSFWHMFLGGSGTVLVKRLLMCFIGAGAVWGSAWWQRVIIKKRAVLFGRTINQYCWFVDSDGSRYYNQSYKELFGEPEGADCLNPILALAENLNEQLIKKINDFKSGHCKSFEGCFAIRINDCLRQIRIYAYAVSGQGALNSFFGYGEDITDAYEQECLLKHQEKQYRLLFENMNSAFALHEIICDEQQKPVNYKFLKVNQKFEQITGLNAKDIIGKTVKEILPGIEEYWIETYGNVALAGEVCNFNDFSMSLNRYYEVTAFSPRKGYFACIFNDISDLVKAEKKLRENEHRFRSILDNMPVMLHAFDDEHNVLFWNKESKRVTGYSADQVMRDKAILDQLYPNCRNQCQAVLATENTGQYFRNREIDFTHADGSDKTVLWSNIAEKYPVSGWAYWAIGVDVTSRKIIENNLKQQLEMERILSLVAKRFAADSDDAQVKRDINWAFEQVSRFLGVQHAVMFKMNRSGKRIYISNEWCDDSIESCKKHFRYLPCKLASEFDPEVAAECLNWERVSETVDRTTLHERCQCYWQQQGVASLLVIPIFRHNDFVACICLESLDVKKELDHNMGSLVLLFVELIGELMERVKIRQELMEAKNQAIESDRLKTEFLANISHEIRTPLNGILGFIELLAHHDFPKDSRDEYLGIINNCAEQLVSLISDLIDISKISCGQLEVNQLPVSLNKELQKLLEVYSERKAQMGKEHIRLLCNRPLSDQAVLIQTDLLRFHQIFNNLLANALKFTEEGYIEFGYDAHPGEYIMFYVKDSGIGIAENMQNLVFDRFTQVDGSHKRKFSGTGLGLHICKQLIGLLNGDIWVESVEGQGATFFFTLPYQQIECPEAEDDRPQIIKTGRQWQGKRILIVDDIPYLHIQLKEIFSKSGVELISAYNGEEAVEVCEKGLEVNLILMDIQMPIMSGLDAVKEIKRAYPHIPVIAQTAHAVVGDRKRFLKAGFDDYIAKPFRFTEIVSKVEQFLN